MGRGGQDSIKRYCEERGLEMRPADPEAIAAYERSMDALIPKIDAMLRKQAKLAAKFRKEILF